MLALLLRKRMVWVGAFAIVLFAVVFVVGPLQTFAQPDTGAAENPANPINAGYNIPFQVPSFQTILGAVIRLFFLVAGLAALFFLLLGAFEWVTSGGDEKKTEGARNKIQAAVIGLILIIVVLSIVALLEVVVFAGTICLGLTCDIKPGQLQLIKKNCIVTRNNVQQCDPNCDGLNGDSGDSDDQEYLITPQNPTCRGK
jgi:hypothetical protein